MGDEGKAQRTQRRRLQMCAATAAVTGVIELTSLTVVCALFLIQDINPNEVSDAAMAFSPEFQPQPASWSLTLWVVSALFEVILPALVVPAFSRRIANENPELFGDMQAAWS